MKPESALKTLTNQNISENMVYDNMESFMKNRLKKVAAPTFVFFLFVLLSGNVAFAFR